MSQRLARNAESIKQLSKCGSKNKRTYILKESNADLIACLVECVHNVLRGKVPLTTKQKKSLKKHLTALRTVSKERKTTRARKLLVQRGGFLPAVLLPIIAAAAGGILSEVIISAIKK